MRGSPPTVDFYLYATHEVAVWEPVWQALRRRGVDAQFVLEPPGVHTAMGSVPDPTNGWRNDTSGELQPLVDESTHEAMAALLQRRGLPWIDARRTAADAVVTTQGAGWLWPYEGLRIKTEYGASAFHGAFGHGAVNEGLDAVLAHGPYSASAMSAHIDRSRIHLVGYPKWAPALRSGLDRATARGALGLPTDGTVVAWLPTWAHNTGIDDYAGALADLAEHHVVVAKPHHNNLRFESARLTAIDARIQVRSDLHSLVELVVAADVVVADARSGALAEAVLGDRPAVGLLPRGGDPRAAGVLGGFEDAVVWCNEPDGLADAITRARSADLGTARSAWRRWLFGDAGPHDDERAADVILRLVLERRGERTTDQDGASLDLAIDRLARNDRPDPHAVCAMFLSAWPRWPGHPRLLALLASVRGELEADELLACSRAVRVAGLTDACPLVAVRGDRRLDPVRRLAATAALALELEDLDAADAFPAQAASLEPGRYPDALLALDRVPSSLPSFVWSVATSPERCAALASALASLGAAAEADLVTTHGRALADGVTVLA
jgi:hypothetical protein